MTMVKRDFSRTDRINELMQRELAQIIQFEVKDPRIGMVTVAGVEVTRDLSHAKVYVTFLKPSEEIKESIAALKKAAPFIRTTLAHRIQLRIMPELHFVYDSSLVEGRRLADLIDKAVLDDEHKHEED